MNLGDLDEVETIIKNGANVNAMLSGGFTPLHYAAAAGTFEKR